VETEKLRDVIKFSLENHKVEELAEDHVHRFKAYRQRKYDEKDVANLIA